MTEEFDFLGFVRRRTFAEEGMEKLFPMWVLTWLG